MLGLEDVFHAVFPEVAKMRSSRQRVLDERPGGPGNDQLPAVGRTCDPSRTVHVHPHIIRSDEDGVSCVKTHSNANGAARRPGVGGEALLRRDRGSECSRSAGEGDEKRIAFSAHFGPAGRGNCLPNDQLVLLPDGGVTIAQVPEQLRRALDVREQERDGASGQLSHALPGRNCPTRDVHAGRRHRSRAI